MIPPPLPSPISDKDKTWALVAHLSAFSGHVVPFGHLLGPLIIWQVHKNELPFAADQAKEALNFQITMTIAFLVAGVLAFLLIGLLILPVVWGFDIIITIIAAVKAGEGVPFRYPCTLRLL